MLSFWEKDFYLKYNQIVVGSGIVGLSTAIALKERNPKHRVLVLEKGLLPTGASTKNAGFACFGSLSEVLVDLKTMAEADVIKLIKYRWDGLQLLRKRLGDEKMDYHQWGGYELLGDASDAVLAGLDHVNDLLHPLFEQKVYRMSSRQISTFGFNKSRVKQMVFNPLEGQIHTGKMMKNLLLLATQLGVEVITGAEVLAFEEKSHGVEIALDGGLKFTAEKVAFCTNAFTQLLLPDVELVPGRGTVLITKPIKDLPFCGTFHYEEGYYYFRNYKNRVIFGGGRNVDLHTEETLNFHVNPTILHRLKSDLSDLILPDRQFEIDHTWSGIMAFGPNKKPIVTSYNDHIFLGVRLGGMGVAIGSRLGVELAEQMTS